MTEFRVSCTVRFFNGAPAPNIDVTAHESGNGDFNVGRTGADGRIDARIRKRRSFHIPFRDIDDPFDNPTFTLNLRDAIGRRHASANVGEVTLPEFFGPDEAAADVTFPAGALGQRARTAIRPEADGKVPGYSLMVRRNGAIWVEVTRGLRIRSTVDQRARAISHDTIVHLASMSKSITATAFATLLDDWAVLLQQVAQIAAGTAPTVSLDLIRRTGIFASRRTVEVPQVLLPLFSNVQLVIRLRNENLLAGLPTSLRDDLTGIAAGTLRAAHAVPAPPGYFELIRLVLRGDTVATFDSAFLPLIRERLGTGSIGAGIDTLKVSDLVCHRTNLDGFDPNRVTAAEAAGVNVTQPPDGAAATFDYWEFTRLLLRRDSGPSRGYQNNNYTVLTTVIETIAGEPFDVYLNRRLFFDPRFDRIRRRVTHPEDGARYYSGMTGGVLYPDYSAWPGNGGHYASSSQLTDWLNVLYSRAAVASVTGGTAPLISADAHERLFTVDGYFSAANIETPVAGTRGYPKNGGTAILGGDVNGKMGIYVSASGAVYTVAFLANGSVDAEKPFNATVNALATSADWT